MERARGMQREHAIAGRGSRFRSPSRGRELGRERLTFARVTRVTRGIGRGGGREKRTTAVFGAESRLAYLARRIRGAVREE